MLTKKSIHELRSIAQGMGILFSFSDDDVQLRQKIELHNKAMIPRADIIPPRPQYDARLMERTPSQISNEGDLLEILTEHVKRGLHISFPEPEQWHISCGKKEDSGNMRMPLRVILAAAERVMG